VIDANPANGGTHTVEERGRAVQRGDPDRLRNVAFMMKDSKRFANSGGWGYGVFNYDSASDKFKPEGTGATCGVGCHAIAKAKDWIFTAYQKR
jgi:hypothetical protein